MRWEMPAATVSTKGMKRVRKNTFILCEQVGGGGAGCALPVTVALSSSTLMGNEAGMVRLTHRLGFAGERMLQ